MSSFPPAYDPKSIEDDIYQMWEKSGFFNPGKTPKPHPTSPLRKGEARRGSAFSIVLPPPNVTGTLHLGHATMLAIEDIMIRYHRMKGDDTLWVPGTDHAAIATQNVVEKKLWQEEKKTRHDLGRAAFLKKVEEFVEQSKDTIHRQMRKMGASLDWSREAYTLDEQRELAVRTVFKKMYDDGLIYRGNRIVNWCTRCQSTLADDEVEYRQQKTKFYYLKYGPVVIGTARPETKFLDKIIIVHPKDKRYKKLVGTAFDVEWIEGKVKATVVADAVADMEMGSGAMTITPAHSFADFALAQKYKFEIHQIINEQGVLTEAAGSMAGMPVKEAREKVVEALQKKGLVDRIDESYVHNLSVCYRCDTPVEPLVSKQWFINVNYRFQIADFRLQKLVGRNRATLKEMAIAVMKKGAIEIIPERFTKTYFHWMENLHDWCISRQIWFGHRIPVWYCLKNRELRIKNYEDENRNSKFVLHNSTDECSPIVSIDEPQSCPTCGSMNLEQDPDTLDTWFSSGLWTFSTLGWPGSGNSEQETRNSDLRRFHPTSVLETGYDILFFWVARMILMTTYVLGDVPFKTVYLHGLVRDEQGRKMSKSIGNVIDPLTVSEKYGTDAVRLALVVGTTPGNDIKISEKKIEGYRNFVNKLWNIARFVASQQELGIRNWELGDRKSTIYNLQSTSLPDLWILSRMQKVVQSVTKDLEENRLSQAAETLRAFTWDELADWYVEISKYELRIKNYEVSARNSLFYILNSILRLWHPFTPFVTEAIHSKFSESSKTSPAVGGIPPEGGDKSSHETPLMIQEWPEANKKLINPKAEKDFAVIQDIITAIRSIRSAYQIDPSAIVNVAVVSAKHRKIITGNYELVEQLAKARVEVLSVKSKGMISAHPKIAGLWIGIEIGDIDVATQKGRLSKTLREIQRHIASLSASLDDQGFIKNASGDVVEARRQMLKSQQSRAKELEQEHRQLESMG